RIARGLMDRSLPKPEWTHAAHFAAAIWMLRDGETDPWRDLPGYIRAYNEATGVMNSDEEGYHETITVASLRAAEHRLRQARPHEPTFRIVNALMASELGRSGWLLAHWSKAVLFSVRARRGWVEPDLAPLPF
ncbi:MAG: hypothetical protein MI723_05940, partial [Caulobacterales bacterium]|nr:hypothetical protein [Caulobacterales bacterium]